MTIDQGLLQRIQSLQFQHKDEAETLLLSFLREVYSEHVAQVELRPLAVSLNSFNGFMTLVDGKRYFFKTHTEADTLISEYYNAGQLADAGYPIIKPIFSSTAVGQQLLVYDVIESESVFDVAWAIENGDGSQLSDLTTAQNSADDKLLDLYFTSIGHQSAEGAAKSPIHQLFYHRLTGGRLERFYGLNHQIALPNFTCSLQEVRSNQWIINGQVYDQSLDDIIQQAVETLLPEQAGMSIIGHGDAHNGNVFYQRDSQPPSLLYFDPAFAGRHNPLLDLTKPLFHNVFAMWMYFPKEKRSSTTISLEVSGNTWIVEHDYVLHPVREMFLWSKIDRVLIPILRQLKSNNALPSNWRAYLKSALFCCPFLTMNLADPQKFSPEISLLGLAMSIEMGAESHEHISKIDSVLNKVQDQLM